jgi:hypothetical protein
MTAEYGDLLVEALDLVATKNLDQSDFANKPKEIKKTKDLGRVALVKP